MKSVVDLVIHAPRERVAALFADPALGVKWMEDLKTYEPISGEPGAPGSQYRLVQKSGDLDFVATVLARDLPDEVRLRLEAETVEVSITARFVAASATTTRLISEEVFRFKSPLQRVFGFLARPVIKRVHRRQMEAFKRFAEREG